MFGAKDPLTAREPRIRPGNTLSRENHVGNSSPPAAVGAVDCDCLKPGTAEGIWGMSTLSKVETRVLGVLMEKAVTTPDQYPLTLNSLTLGCNQKTSRDPVMDLHEAEVEAALDELRDRRLAWRVDLAGSRVPKFRHRIDEAWELAPAEYALLCVLALRGPQTLGQLRQRTERLFGFRDLDHVRDTLEAMQDRAEEPLCLVQPLPVRPGSKELRFTHTLYPFEEDLGSEELAPVTASTLPPSPRDQLIAELKEEVATLRSELEGLRADFETFKAQF